MLFELAKLNGCLLLFGEEGRSATLKPATLFYNGEEPTDLKIYATYYPARTVRTR